MTVKTLLAATCFSIVTATSGIAAPVDFNFSFSDGINTVTGLIQGLDSDGLDQAASSVTVYGLEDTYTFTPRDFASNSFDVIAGSIIAEKTRFSAFNVGDGQMAYGMFDMDGDPSYANLDEGDGTGIRFATTFSDQPVSYTPLAAVPLPAGLPMLIAGFGAVGIVRRSRKSKSV